MWKKIAAGLVIVAALAFSQPAAAQVAAPVVPPPVVVAGSAQALGWAFPIAVGFAAFVVYADAEGIDFPLCGAWGLKCYDRYPGDE